MKITDLKPFIQQHTFLTEDTDLRSSDGHVVSVRNHSHNDSTFVQQENRPAQLHVREAEHTQVQWYTCREEMHEEPGEGRLNPMGKGTCTEGGEKGEEIFCFPHYCT